LRRDIIYPLFEQDPGTGRKSIDDKFLLHFFCV